MEAILITCSKDKSMISWVLNSIEQIAHDQVKKFLNLLKFFDYEYYNKIPMYFLKFTTTL